MQEQAKIEGKITMKIIDVTDLRNGSRTYGDIIKIGFDVAKVTNFDTRGQCESMWEETWGQRVKTTRGMVYIECNSRGLGDTLTDRFFLADN